MEKHRILFRPPRCPGCYVRIGRWLVVVAVLSADYLAGYGMSQAVPNKPPATELQGNLFPGQNLNPGKQDEQLLENSFIPRDQSVFVPAPRDLLRPLIRAKRAIREQDIPLAVSLLSEVLNDSMTEDFLVPLSVPEGVSVSLRLKAQAILGSLPPKDRQLYRLRYGVQAKQMLEQAIEESDFELVSQVMQRFFYTDAGFDAAMLLGHHHLDQGRPIAAANCFQRVVGSEEARAIHDPEASVLLATCWVLSDSPDRATDVLVNLRNYSPSKTIQFGGKPIRLFDRPEDASGWLLKLIGDSPLRNIELVNQWVMVGGNPQRNARSGMGFPLLNPRWVTPTMNHPDLEKSVRELQRELIVLDSAPVPSVQPLAIGHTIVMRAFDRMVGVDFETGKRVWVFPPWDFTDRFDGPDDRLKTRVINKAPLTERMWLDAVYGQASSDGQTIFVVPKPGFSKQVRTPIFGDAEPTLSRTFNELMAIDIAREGAFVWEVGGESGLDEPKLAKSFFLGAPLPLEDELFAVCQQATEIRLVALDAGTGKLKWHQQIGTTESSAVKLLNDPYRRLAGVTPSFAKGILVCSTGNGALVAVDVSTRSLLWGYQYTTPSRKAVQPISAFRTSNSDPLDGLWRDSTILIADGKVMFAPVDAQDLICVDLQNGFPTWNSPAGLSAKLNRNDSMFLACVENGLAILVGETSVRAISVKTGQQVWERPILELGKPSGRGYTNHGYYYFPTTREKLVQIRLATGEISKTVETDGVLGNLICYRGHVISHGVDRLACFPQDAPNRKRVVSAEAAGNLTPELLAIRAQLQMQDGRFRDAVNSIEEAYVQQPSRAYESLLLDWMVRLVEEDFDYGIKLAMRHEDRLLANRRFEFLAAKINGMMHNNHAVAAVDELFRLLVPSSQFADQHSDFLEITTIKHDRNLRGDENEPERAATQQDRITIRLDRWIGSRLRLLHAQGSDDLRTLIETRIGKLAEANKESAAVDRHDALRNFPMELIPDRSRLDLARGLVESGNALRAVHVLESLSDSQDSRVAAIATVMLAKEFLRKKMYKHALESIEKLETEFASVNLDGNQNLAEMVDVLRGRLNDGQADTSEPSKWNQGSIRVTTEVDSENIVNLLAPSPIELVEYDSQLYAEYQYQFFRQTGEIEILDGNGNSIFRFLARETSQPLYSALSNDVLGRISIKNNLALVDISTEILAFDWLKLQQGVNPVLWNLSITGEQDSSFDSGSGLWREMRTKATPNTLENRVFVSSPGFDGICYLDRNQLVCLDPVTGKRNWQRSNLPPKSRLFGDSKHVIVWDSQTREALIIESADGRLIGTTRLAQEVGSVWQAYGCKFLVSSDSPMHRLGATQAKERDSDDQGGSRQTLQQFMGLYDLLEDKFIWKAGYPTASMACRVGRDRIAILQPGKDLEFIDLQTGNVEIHTPLNLDVAERAKVKGIGVSINQGNYLVHFNRGVSPSRVTIDSRNIRIRPLSYRERLWVGSLICVDPVTGANLWENAVRFDNFQLGPSQPKNAPIYLLVRNVNKEDESGMSMNYIQFVGIDSRTGKLAANYLLLNNQGIRPPFRISCDPDKQQLTIKSSGNQIKFEWIGDSQMPPRPVAHLTNQNSIPDVRMPSQESTVDREMIESVKLKSLERAMAAQKLLPQKRADEKRRLQAEQADLNDK